MTESDERSDEARQTFEYFSNEYAQALHAFKAIEDQSTTLMLLGVADDLRGFVDQFIEMSTRTKRLAEEKNEPHFAESRNSPLRHRPSICLSALPFVALG